MKNSIEKPRCPVEDEAWNPVADENVIDAELQKIAEAMNEGVPVGESLEDVIARKRREQGL